jgi:hypothetical protein
MDGSGNRASTTVGLSVISSTASVTLAWAAVTTDSAGRPLSSSPQYRLHYGLTSGAYTVALDVGTATTSTVSGLNVPMKYYFAVRAADGDGSASGYSQELAVLVTNAAAGVAASAAISSTQPGDGMLNLVLPENGGLLNSFTSQYSATMAAACLTDGMSGSSAGSWSSALAPGRQAFVYTFAGDEPAILGTAVLYNYGAGLCYSREFEIWTSPDGEGYALLTNGVLEATTNAQVFSLGNTSARAVQLVIANGYRTDYWQLSEFQLFGTLPLVTSSSNLLPSYGPANLTDGQTNTMWIGAINAATWWISVDLGQAASLNDFNIDFGNTFWVNTFVGGSVTGSNDWFDMMSATNWPIRVRYICVNMWNDPCLIDPPAIRELGWQ